jgi:hypothetical protein
MVIGATNKRSMLAQQRTGSCGPISAHFHSGASGMTIAQLHTGSSGPIFARTGECV